MNFNSDICTVVEFLHVKPGKGPAFVRTKLKSLTTGKVVDNTFPSGHKIDEVRVERRVYQYLYKDDMGYQFMNNETFDQLTFEEALINAPQFLVEGMNVEVLINAGNETPLTRNYDGVGVRPELPGVQIAFLVQHRVPDLP